MWSRMLDGRTEAGNAISVHLVESAASALGKSDPFALTKSDPHQEHDLPVGKEKSDIIHAEGVRFAFTSSVRQAPYKAIGRQELIGWLYRQKRPDTRGLSAWQTAVADQ